MIDGHFRIDTKILSGVPQGSFLGPLLFIIYINDLPNCVQNSVCRLFADDCILCRQIRSLHDSNKLQTYLDQLQKWESKWLMEFHPSKCQVISITNKVKPIIGDNQIHDPILEQINNNNNGYFLSAISPESSYLGAYIDSKLTFNTHADAIVKKASPTCAFLARNIVRCCRKVKRTTYSTYIRLIVKYASPVWDSH